MTTYVINYDLITPGKNYEELYKAIKSYGIWAHPLESCWLICTSSTSEEVYKKLSVYLDSNDKILIIKSGIVGMWKGLPQVITDWLKKNL